MGDDGILIDGLWIPEGDEQLLAMVTGNPARWKRPTIDGVIHWHWNHIGPALELVPAERRRVAVDVGANIGLWSRLLVPRFETVWAFEPVAAHRDCLIRNTPRTLRIEGAALGDSYAQQVAFTREQAVSGRSHITPPTTGEAWNERVKMRALDWYGITDVDFLKIDVEGFERRVLIGGEDTIRRDKPMIVIEQLGHEERYGEPRDAALALLKDWGAVELRENIKGDYYVGWRD